MISLPSESKTAAETVADLSGLFDPMCRVRQGRSLPLVLEIR